MMPVRDFTTAHSELDKLQAVEPGEDHIESIKVLVSRGDKVHVELHLTVLEADHPKLDTRAVRAAL